METKSYETASPFFLEITLLLQIVLRLVYFPTECFSFIPFFSFFFKQCYKVNDEVVYTRAHSIATGTRVQSFKEQVQARDGRCVISKVENRRAAYDVWLGFEAAHIFPLAYEQQWLENNYGRWITIDPPQWGKINSVQNGLLLKTNLHILFDHYVFSINPDVRFLTTSNCCMFYNH